MLNLCRALKPITVLLSLGLLLGLLQPCPAQEPTNTPNPTEQQQQHQDAPAPEPHSELKSLVDAIPKLIDERKYTEALQQADALLQQATEKNDKIGQAYAHRFRAWALQGLNKLEEALPAWEQAEQLWREAGDGAFVVEALLGRAFCLWRTDEGQAKKLLQQALEMAKAEARRPLAAAQALNNIGTDWYHTGALEVAQRCWEQELALYERLAPNSLEIARTLNNLGWAALSRGDLDTAQRYLEQALAFYERLAPNSLEVAGTLVNLGVVASERGDLGLAQRYYEQALALYERLAPNSLEVASTLGNLGLVALDRGDLALAQRYYEQALAIRERLAPNSLEMADTLGSLGKVALDRGNLGTAQQYFEQALAIQERLAPNSLQMAGTLNNLGIVAANQGDLGLAQRYFEQALAIQKPLAPDSLDVAGTLCNLGNVAYHQSDLGLAQQYYKQALAIQERLAPDSLQVAGTLIGLGNVVRNRGDLEEAQRYFEQALDIQERLAPNSLDVAITLNNLGNVALDRGDLALAQQYFEQALAIQERLAPNSLEMAHTLNALGLVALDRGNLDTAQQYFEQALAIQERLAPNSPGVATSLNSPGNLVYYRGDLGLAQRYFEQALEILNRFAPDSLDVACLVNNLGQVARQKGDYAQATQYAQRVYDLRAQIAPQSLAVASALDNLGRLWLRQNQPHEALRYFQQAVGIVEQQRQAITDPEARALFCEEYFGSYLGLALAHLLLHQPAQAAEALERSRARSLAETLHQRQLALSESLPKPLRQLLQQQQQLNAQRQHTYRQLQQTKPDNKEQATALQRRLREIDQQQRELDERIRQQFPDFARQYLPTPLTIQQIQQSLDAGTVLLYHALTEDHLLIVAVSRTQVQGVARKVDGKQLENDIRAFHRLVSRAGDFLPNGTLPPRSASDRRELARRGQQLYAQLIAPVQGMLKGAQRVLLCPDGLLSQLPWAALVVQVQNGKPVYWIERVALHLTPSVGVYRQARQAQPASQGVAVAAVWQYTHGKPIELAQNRRSEVARLLRRSGAGTMLTDLPSVQEEVKALQRVWGKQAKVALNAQATPQQAKRLAANARVVHFACHARADNADPLGSALLLAPAGSEVGLLTAGEVLLGWRLRSDLVMLSACETGVGVARRYEGVYSLGRAFLAAGSRSVGMSLWAVSDRATVVLMQEFYGWYVRGVGKDEALRGAQLALRRSVEYADPYFWSGFVLMGDYRQGK